MRAPLAAAEIRSASKSRSSRYFATDDPERFSKIFTFETFRRAILSSRISKRDLDFCRGYRPPGKLSEKSLRSLVEQLRQPICVRNFQLYDAGIRNFAERFERSAGCATRIDCFYMPGGRKGALTRWHIDSMDKFLVQFEGEITYLLYEPRRGLRSRKAPRREQDYELSQEIRVRKGEICYIPKGMPHQHKLSSSAESIHAPVWLIK